MKYVQREMHYSYNGKMKKRQFKLIRENKAKLEQFKTREEVMSERSGNLNRAAELRHGIIPSLVKEIEGMSESLAQVQQGTHLLREEVTDDDIAAIVSKWTGIPVTKMLQSEMEKYINLETILQSSGNWGKMMLLMQ